jgi:putative acyl-CoA dehydrogenase
LDVLRAAVREPEGFEAFLAECERAGGADARLDSHLAQLKRKMTSLTGEERELETRRLVEEMGVALQASLLVRHAPSAVSDAFCASRLGGGGHAFGTLPAGIDAAAITERALTI